MRLFEMGVISRNKTHIVAVILLLAASSGYTCGPLHPNYVLTGGDEIVLAAPTGHIREEIERVKPSVVAKFTALSRGTKGADLMDLRAALSEKGGSRKKRESILEAYGAVRDALSEHHRFYLTWEREKQRQQRFGKTYDVSAPQFGGASIPKGLPREFEDYLRGAISYHSGRKKEAVDIWRKLLDRPAAERKYRSTWAAYMIGRALSDRNPPNACEWFEYVRQLAESGFEDSLGLAAESLGRQGQAELKQGNFAKAIELYIAHEATGDRTAAASLQITVNRALRAEPAVLARAAEEPVARSIITAFVISWGGQLHWKPLRGSAERWAKALEMAKVDSVENADRLAWAAYKGGNIELAERFVALASKDSVVAKWIECKLLLRAGDVSGAVERLSTVVARFPPADRPRLHPANRKGADGQRGTYPYGEVARGELAVLKVARREYIEALDVLIKGGFWGDAAYVAENVLSPEELIAYVDRAWPPLSEQRIVASSYETNDSTNPDWFNVRIRFLLGRRLAQLGRYKEARKYYPPRWQAKLDSFTEHLGCAGDASLPNRRRAREYWRAACLTRREPKLLGTERSLGYTRYRRTPTIRLKSRAKLVGATEDERRRLELYARGEKGYPVDHVAAEYAWKAAKLMPDNSDETAHVLCSAGWWLQLNYPKDADRFYKALVNRCRKTALGAEADKLRWFPKIDIARNKLLEDADEN